MRTNVLYDFYESDKQITINFKKKDVDYSEDIKYFDEDFFKTIFAKNLLIKGRAPIEIYSYIVFWCIKNGSRSIFIDDFNTSKNMRFFIRGTIIQVLLQTGVITRELAIHQFYQYATRKAQIKDGLLILLIKIVLHS